MMVVVYGGAGDEQQQQQPTRDEAGGAGAGRGKAGRLSAVAGSPSALNPSRFFFLNVDAGCVKWSRGRDIEGPKERFEMDL
ncbi:hypothetical protein E3N88_23113 [Mikania micrantha]|uniref:Uncharacterized protein n=1 Tax=Mikania micrantha TaxID=192012 RepID=A0A5N6NCE1_9ASTR|nr:hypothetical protein E3N88_23113 [Mikania micrantha]